MFVADGSNGWRVLLSSQGFWSTVLDGSAPEAVSDFLFLADLDNDGLSEVIKSAGSFVKARWRHPSTGQLGSWEQTTPTTQTGYFFKPVLRVGDLVGDARDDVLAFVPALWTMFVSDGGTGPWQEYWENGSGGIHFPASSDGWEERTWIVPHGSGGDRLMKLGSDGVFSEFVHASGSWVEHAQLPVVAPSRQYYQFGNFNNDGFLLDMVMNGWIPDQSLSEGDISNVESIYGPCPNTLRHKFTNCYNPVPIGATVAAIL